MNAKSTLAVGLFAMIALLITAAKPNLNYRANNLRFDYSHDYWATMPRDSIREFEAFTTSFDGLDDDNGDGKSDRFGIPEWVSYQIKTKPAVQGKSPDRPTEWMTDRVLFNAGLAPADDTYRYSKAQRDADPDNPIYHYDRGHMCRKFTAFRLGAEADYNTHTVLNACPQRDDLNQGIWEDLEGRIEDWADGYGSVWVVCGPIIKNKKPKKWLGETGEMMIVIPDEFFKVVVRSGAKNNHPEVLAFIYPQDAPREKPYSAASHKKYLVSVDKIEKATGIDFFTRLSEADQKKIEAKKAKDLWN